MMTWVGFVFFFFGIIWLAGCMFWNLFDQIKLEEEVRRLKRRVDELESQSGDDCDCDCGWTLEDCREFNASYGYADCYREGNNSADEWIKSRQTVREFNEGNEEPWL